MSTTTLEECISRLRYIPLDCITKCSDENFDANKDWCMANCEARADDVNTPSECIRMLRDILSNTAVKLGLDPQFVYELDPIIQKFRVLKSGDILLPDDLNNINDAIKKARDIIYRIEEVIDLLQSQQQFIQSIAGIGIGIAYSETIDPAVYYKPFQAFVVEQVYGAEIEAFTDMG